MASRLNLTRDQLAAFLENHEQIRQFERLFAAANELIPSTINDLIINTGNANQKAVEALDAISSIANSLEVLAAAPVIQNNNSVVTDYIDLPENGPHVSKERRVQWNRDDGTMDIGLYGGAVLQVGQELHYYSKNTSGGLISIGTPVMFTGTVGSSGKLTFGLAVADGSVISDYMMGVAAQDIADNDFGYITSFGLLRGFNTTGAPYGESWADGDLLYFDPATPGTWTKFKPNAPAIDVPVAVVVNAGSGSSGSIFVRMTVAEALSRLQDVYISGTGIPANDDVLVYDLTDSRWENRTQSTLSVGTSANLAAGAMGSVPYQSAPGTTAMLAIGTASQVLKVNSGATAPQWVSGAALTRSNDTNVTLTLGGSPSTALLAAVSLSLGWTGQLSVARGGTGTGTAFTTGSVVFAGASGTYTQDNANFFWDNTNNRLGIGGTSPDCALDVTGGIQTSRTAVTSPATTDGNIFSGTYTPSQVSTNTNVDSVTFSEAQYLRVGNSITVSGQIVIDATTAATDTVVKMSLPVASSFSATRQLAGVGSSITSPYAANDLAFIAETTNDCVEIRLNPSVNTSLTYSFSFTYRVI